jgi:hypothetical protein
MLNHRPWKAHLRTYANEQERTSHGFEASTVGGYYA